MNKAFIFDMDGVIVDSEKAWKKIDPEILARMLPTDIVEKVGDTMGLSLKAICDKVVSLGATIDEKRYTNECNKAAAHIYATSPITGGLDEVVAFLVKRGFKIGLVSASQQNSIDIVLARLPFREKFDVVLSVNDHPSLRQKPHPDSYQEVLGQLDADPRASIIIEDSNPGIAAAKAAGCFVIAFREHLMPEYQQVEADSYAFTMSDVIKIVTRL